MSLARELNLDVPFSDMYHEAVLNIVRTASLLTTAGDSLFRQFDLTEAQFNVLFALKYNPRSVTQTDLGKRLVISRASVTSVLDRLESKGLVRRVDVPDNRRIYHVALTEKGRRLIEELEPLYREKIHEVMGGFETRECRQLIAILERIRGQVNSVQVHEPGSIVQ